jgi:hypothetical protein
MSKRRTHRPEFKAKVAMEAISGRKTIQQVAADHAIGLRNAAVLPVRPDPGEPVEASAGGWCQRAVQQGQEDQGRGRGAS